jgi:hypothetical protein
MAKDNKEEKKHFAQKLLEFKKQGLISYGKYLDKEHNNSIDKPIKASYLEYIQKEIKSCQKRIDKIDVKLANK